MSAHTNRGIRSACDRCYQLKERCDRPSFDAPCVRCKRLKQSCLAVRPILPTGRRRANTVRSKALQKVKQTRDKPQHLRSNSQFREIPGLSREDAKLLKLLLGDEQSLQYPVVSPRFQPAEQESFSGPLPSAWPVLKDAYLAYASVLDSLQSQPTTVQDNASKLRHVSAAILALRSLPIATIQDAELCLTLGFVLALSVYGTIGVGVSDICHYCLSTTKPFIEAASLDPSTESRISMLVLLETMECMVHRRKPTLRMQPRAPMTVDRHLGLCLPLLSYYHDLCAISHALSSTTDMQRVMLLHEQLDDIEAQVQIWHPSPPQEFFSDFDTTEVIQLLAQARVYRLAALLVIHRLRHRFGDEDAQAAIWSREAMMELELAARICDHAVRFVALPFIIAAVEVRDPTERVRVLASVDLYVDQLTPVVQEATRKFLTRVWCERDAQPGGSWFESVHKPCVVLDSINPTFSGHVFVM